MELNQKEDYLQNRLKRTVLLKGFIRAELGKMKHTVALNRLDQIRSEFGKAD